jgi:hypothetical protein
MVAELVKGKKSLQKEHEYLSIVRAREEIFVKMES